MAKIKKLINKFKNWLIVKLCGYDPRSEFKVYKTELKTIPLCASLHVSEDSELMNVTQECRQILIEERLIDLIAREIMNRKIYEIDSCEDYEANGRVYRIKCLMVEPTGDDNK